MLFGVVRPGDRYPGVSLVGNEAVRKLGIRCVRRVHRQERPRAMPVIPIPDADLFHEPISYFDRIRAVRIGTELSRSLVGVHRP